MYTFHSDPGRASELHMPKGRILGSVFRFRVVWNLKSSKLGRQRALMTVDLVHLTAGWIPLLAAFIASTIYGWPELAHGHKAPFGNQSWVGLRWVREVSYSLRNQVAKV